VFGWVVTAAVGVGVALLIFIVRDMRDDLRETRLDVRDNRVSINGHSETLARISANRYTVEMAYTDEKEHSEQLLSIWGQIADLKREVAQIDSIMQEQRDARDERHDSENRILKLEQIK